MDELEDREILPNPAFVSSGQAERAACEFAICWNVKVVNRFKKVMST
jgi:topoisomerase-4 subunit B